MFNRKLIRYLLIAIQVFTMLGILEAFYSRIVNDEALFTNPSFQTSLLIIILAQLIQLNISVQDISQGSKEREPD